MPSATAIAEEIRRQIREETSLTASAGIAPNKFLAKIASDWRKPDGQFVIRPQQVEAFLAPLPVAKIPGVGKVMQGKLSALGIELVGDLREYPMDELQRHFGSFGASLYRRARGIDERPVQPDQPVQSISAEDTFEHDVPLEELAPTIRRLAVKTWEASRKTERVGRTVVLKLKTSQFRILTRSHTPETPPDSLEALTDIALVAVRNASSSRTERCTGWWAWGWAAFANARGERYVRKARLFANDYPTPEQAVCKTAYSHHMEN